MKKLISFLICIIITLLIPFSAFADDSTYNTMNDLFQYWEENGYPDYVCGVWSNDGTLNDLTVSLLDNEDGEKGRQEILSSVKHSDKITFEYAKYSRNELTSIQDELYEKYQEFNIDSMIFSTALLEQENRVELGLDLEKRTDEIDKLIAFCEKEYGDKVVIVQGEPCYDVVMYDTLPDDYNGSTANNNSFLLMCAGAAIVMILLATVAYERKKSKRALITTTGETVTTEQIDEAQLESMIKNSKKSPSKEFDEKMLSYFKDQ